MLSRGEQVRPVAQRLYRETEGNPFFLMQVLKALFDSGVMRLEGGAWRGDFSQMIKVKLPLPMTLGKAILARTRRVQRANQEALNVAAVLGREFDFDLFRF